MKTFTDKELETIESCLNHRECEINYILYQSGRELEDTNRKNLTEVHKDMVKLIEKVRKK